MQRARNRSWCEGKPSARAELQICPKPNQPKRGLKVQRPAETEPQARAARLHLVTLRLTRRVATSKAESYFGFGLCNFPNLTSSGTTESIHRNTSAGDTRPISGCRGAVSQPDSRRSSAPPDVPQSHRRRIFASQARFERRLISTPNLWFLAPTSFFSQPSFSFLHLAGSARACRARHFLWILRSRTSYGQSDGTNRPCALTSNNLSRSHHPLHTSQDEAADPIIVQHGRQSVRKIDRKPGTFRGDGLRTFVARFQTGSSCGQARLVVCPRLFIFGGRCAISTLCITSITDLSQ